PCLIYLASGFNPLHFKTYLAAELSLLFKNRTVDIKTGLYGDLAGNIERLSRLEAESGVIMMEWSDLDARLGIRSLGSWAPNVLSDILSNAHARTEQIKEISIEASRYAPLVVCLPTLPLLPVSFTPTWQASAFELELKVCVESLGAQLVQSPRIRMVSLEYTNSLCPPAERWDVDAELSSGFPYRLRYASLLAGAMARFISPPQPLKGLITDLDDTVWRGILGEDGVDGISWDLNCHSHMHGAYQRMLHALSAAGVLIAAASKNDPQLVEEAFQKRQLILPRDAIFPLEANWCPKSESVGRILKAWNIGADSVVFVDDSPMELAEVAAVHPGIRCLQFPTKDQVKINDLLSTLRDLFGKNVLLAEDLIRVKSVRLSHQEQQDREQSGVTPGEFLKLAEAKIDFHFGKTPLDPRAIELVNKTNQFNLNGIRKPEAYWQAWLKNPDSFVMLVSYQDKYGPLGEISVLVGRRIERKLFLDSWVMSCRAFSRQIEHRCLQELYARFDVDEIEFDFAATDRNKPLQAFLSDMLGEPPFPGCILRRAYFFAKCPQKFRDVEEFTYE
ncbi:MAG TPA: HAD-IIIC family phosphatase, partial [Terriglobia bacterium]|nr:HAD-IIIC family phosphatase [Terriglobia bacterium]